MSPATAGKLSSLDMTTLWSAEIAMVLGSGLGSVACKPLEKIAIRNFLKLPKPHVPGHRGEFSLGEIAGKRVIFACGRVHLYEGRTAGEVTSIVRVLARAGCETFDPH